MGAGLSLMVSVAVPLGAGFASGFLTKDEVDGWYKDIKKPKWNPPNWLFGPAWSVFYLSMGIASWSVWRSGAGRATPLALYGAQLALNLAWTPLFFKAHALDASLLDITALLGIATAATVKMSQQANPKVVAPLMAPYLGWVAFATALNAELLRLNPKETAIDYSKVKKRAKEDTAKVKKAAKETGEKAAAKVKETSEVAKTKAKEAAAKAAETAQEVSSKAQHVASEVSRKAQEDAAQLASVVKDAVGGGEEATPPLSS